MLLAFGWLVYELVANSQPNAQDDALKHLAADALSPISTAPPSELNGTTTPSLTGAEDLRHRTDPFVEVLTSSGVVLSRTGRVGRSAPAVPATLLGAPPLRGYIRTRHIAGAPHPHLFAGPWTRTDLGLGGF